MRKTLLLALPLLAACNNIPTYEPIVDRPSPAYAQNLAECRNLGIKAQREYGRQQVVGSLAGALLGAAVGASLGNSDTALAGAALGTAAGAGDMDGDRAAARVIDRCMAGRGENIVSDLGRG